MKYLLIPFIIFSSLAWSAEEDPNFRGWKNTANLGANLSFSSSKDVVGQTDGSSETYGLNLKSGFNRFLDKSEWRTDGSLITSTTRSPNISRFIKSNDELKVSTMYLHFWNGNKNFGPYARAEASAPMFKGEDVQSASKTYQIIRKNGSTSTWTGTSYRLTDGFKPLNTKESLGVFWKAINDENLKVEARAGAAALQIDAGGQFTVKGTDTAGNILVNELEDVNQFGLEGAITVKGKIDEKSGYEAGIESLTPFASNKKANDDRDALRLTNVDAYVKLTSKFTSWASFGYDYKVKLQPQLVERAQQIHMIVININYNLL